jgi:hypothetical protein
MITKLVIYGVINLRISFNELDLDFLLSKALVVVKLEI